MLLNAGSRFVLCGLLLASAAIAQDPPDPVWPPAGWVLVADMWLPADAVYGDANYDGDPWLGSIVPYTWGVGLTTLRRAEIRKAIAEVEAVSQVRFIPRDPARHADYVIFREHPTAANLSDSALGRIGGPQTIRIGSSHWQAKYVIVHEIFHALGFFHEQQRPDRGSYVRINYANVSQTDCNGMPCDFAFDIEPNVTTVGPYDFLSIMHYGQNFFTIGTGPTIEVLPPNEDLQDRIGNRTFMTDLDAGGVAARYGGPSRPVISGLSPSRVTAGASSVTIVVSGALFNEGSPTAEGVQGSKVVFDGREVPTTWLEGDTLLATVPADLLRTPRIVSVAVRNDAMAGGQSGVLLFDIDYPPCGSAGDRVGYDVLGIGDVDGDDRGDFVMGSPGVNGRGEVVCRSSDGSVVWSRQGGVGDQYGQSVGDADDWDGDGVNEVIVGAPAWNGFRGYAQVLNGRTGSIVATYQWGAPNEEFGWDVDGVGDLDGDGVPDVLIGIPRLGAGGGWRVLSGTTGAVIHSGSTGNTNARYGERVAGGRDANGDRIPDFLVSAPHYDGVNGVDQGRVILFSGANGGVLASWDGDAPYDYFGRSIAQMAAPFGDGLAWSLVGAADFGNLFGANAGPGYARVFRAAPGYSSVRTHLGDTVGDRLGQSVAMVGDVNQDGAVDYAIGADQEGAGSSPNIGNGYVRIHSGADGSLLWTARGEPDDENFGWSVAGVGDIDGDAAIELIVGAPLGNVPCINAGTWRTVDPRVAPESAKVMITEIALSEPQAVELTNYGTTPVSLLGWDILWNARTPGGPILAPTIRASISVLSVVTLQPGERVTLTEPGAGLPPAPPGSSVLPRFPNLQVPTLGVSVALRNRAGGIVDEVRIADQNGTFTPRSLGGLFRGAVDRDPAGAGTHEVAQRIEGLDSNSGGDWTIGSERAFGLRNAATGFRGSDPLPKNAVIFDEIDAANGYVELHAVDIVDPDGVDLRGWSFLRHARQGQSGVRSVIGGLGERLVSGARRIVVGRSVSPPAELPGTVSYYTGSDVAPALTFSGREFSLALYDHHGRLIELVRTSGDDDLVAHNEPRAPSSWNDFTGVVQRAGPSTDIFGRRLAVTDTNTGVDFRATTTRQMGVNNIFTGIFPPDPIMRGVDVRLDAAPPVGGGLTIIVAAGPERAGERWSFFWDLGHFFGQGPLFGLGPNAINNYLLTGLTPPFSGFLDASGTGRLDLPAGSVPPGAALDTIFVLQGAGGSLTARTGILMFDS